MPGTLSPGTLSWLVARPIAHRGLHDAAVGVVENSLTAAQGAIDKNYAIECDVRLSADGDAIVFHDATLARLCGRPESLARLTRSALARITYTGTQEPIVHFADLLQHVGGRVPLIVELKSMFDGDPRLARRVCDGAKTYAGPLAFQSFDPHMLELLRENDAQGPCGLIAEARYDAVQWPELSGEQRLDFARPANLWRIKPDFLAWNVEDLPHVTPLFARAGLGIPVLAWTVRTAAQRLRAERFADQIIFESLIT